ncbi:MAG: glycine cleavage system H protein [marine bacterium B5-7]|nr:MAG: glycine cleavage system H protein [marine bacterium B5-7]
MSDIENDRRYTASHEWVKADPEGGFTVGITDHAQALLGELVFVELPEVGLNDRAGTDCAVVESVKAASDVYLPIEGEVTEINEALADSPDLVNKDPFHEGWLFRMQASSDVEFDSLMDAETYQNQIDSES